ncbi:hypothetical protein SAMN04488136_101290 [Vibrio xiamenensis]|uniref:Uncharacterized protein n=1 Tax=Vibrio xiamenensis TaxID=861298 RepID=A0A1G7WAF3_9VIBR|nr:DUF6201 family protein [Vibrio xiamenensis]SDG68973.1 hypothetical protein SAMN04488136_101290 [Vibrio xiamenensis]
MTFKRFIIALFSIPLLAYWLILSPVIPNKNIHDPYYTYSEDRKWKIAVYDVSPTTPISLVQYIQEKNYIVLYNENDEYIGQSTPFCYQSLLDYNAIFPDSDLDDLLFLPKECDYSIPEVKPRWWSRIIKFRLSL